MCLNTVENVDQFLLDINQGRWDAVLPQITHLRLPTEKLYDLYEQIVCEMIELRETDTAHAMLRTMKVFKRLQHDDAERFMRLDRMSNPCASFAAHLMFSSGCRSRHLRSRGSLVRPAWVLHPPCRPCRTTNHGTKDLSPRPFPHCCIPTHQTLPVELTSGSRCLRQGSRTGHRPPACGTHCCLTAAISSHAARITTSAFHAFSRRA